MQSIIPANEMGATFALFIRSSDGWQQVAFVDGEAAERMLGEAGTSKLVAQNTVTGEMYRSR